MISEFRVISRQYIEPPPTPPNKPLDIALWIVSWVIFFPSISRTTNSNGIQSVSCVDTCLNVNVRDGMWARLRSDKPDSFSSAQRSGTLFWEMKWTLIGLFALPPWHQSVGAGQWEPLRLVRRSFSNGPAHFVNHN